MGLHSWCNMCAVNWSDHPALEVPKAEDHMCTFIFIVSKTLAFSKKALVYVIGRLGHPLASINTCRVHIAVPRVPYPQIPHSLFLTSYCFIFSLVNPPRSKSAIQPHFSSSAKTFLSSNLHPRANKPGSSWRKSKAIVTMNLKASET